ncbi:MAG: hypothetical protein CMK07_14340 [Ponticaulis sp.]|nr:hypothetical protein [Ponticaulis sp.]
MNNTKCLSIIALLAASFGSPAMAEDPELSFGAHIFIDYENETINDQDVLDDTNLRLFRVDFGADYEGLSFRSSTDLQGDEINIRDLFLEFGGDFKVRIGNFKVMNGLEQSSSLYSTTFMEGNSVSKINGFSRATGIAVFKSIGDFQLSGGVFGPDANIIDESDMYSASARVSWAAQPFGEDSTLHLGSSFRYRDSNGSGFLSYGQRAFGRSGPKTISTAKVGESDTFIGLEAALLKGGFFAQSEWGTAQVQCGTGICPSDPHEDAWYVDVGYVWGGRRVIKNGLFKRTAVDNPATQGGFGAFALSARYDVADLSDAGVIGGKQETAVLGLTWYRDKYIRLMANISHSDFEDSPTYGDGDAETVLLRAQFEFY